MCKLIDLSGLHLYGSQTSYLGGKVTKIVHFDEVEVVFPADQIRQQINPLKSLLIGLPTLFGHRGTANLMRTFIGA